MNKQDWAPEPLTHDGVWFVDANGHQLGGQDALLDEATAQRMMACYNACAGVPTEALKHWGKWLGKYTETCPDCNGARIEVTTIGLQINDKMEKWTQLHTLCHKCDGIGKVPKEAADGRQDTGPADGH